MYLGIEIGGTKLQLGIGTGDGTIATLWRGAVVPANGADGIRKQIVGAIPELLANAKRGRDKLKGAGIGFGGPVDDATRSVIKSHQITGWDGFPLAQWIEEITGLRAVLGNDADVAGLAEALFGAGKGLSPIFYITIGSGIGGGLIINGEIYRGCGRGAAEIGHQCWEQTVFLDDEFFREFSGKRVLEEVASGWGIQANARAYLENFGDRDAAGCARLFQLCENSDLITVQHVALAASENDRVAKMLLRTATSALAEGICNVIALLGPRRIVIGGGVSLIGDDLFFEPIRHAVANMVFKPFADCYDIVPAALGEEVVVHGALALARKRLA